MKSRPAIAVTGLLLAAGCGQPAPTLDGPLTLRSRLLGPAARLAPDPAFPNPLAGLVTRGRLSADPYSVVEGTFIASFAENRNFGFDQGPALLLRGQTRFVAEEVEVHEGDVLSFRAGTVPTRRWRSPARPRPGVDVLARASDGAQVTARIPLDPKHPGRLAEHRVDLGPLAGKKVRIELALGGWLNAPDDHAIVADPGIYSLTERSTRANVVWIWLDKLRFDLLEAGGGPKGWLPNLNALAAESIWFDQARAASNHTGMSIPQTFFSTHSVFELEHIDGVTLPSVSSVLADAGWYSVSMGVSPHTAPKLPGWGNEAIDAHHDRAIVELRIEPGFDDPALFRRQVEPWFRNEAREPFFANIHYQGAHEDFRVYPAEYDAKYGEEALRLAHGDPLEAGYFLKAKAADAVVGQTIALLKERGLWDRSLVMLFGDHGSTLGPDHRFFEDGWPMMVRASHPAGMYDQQLRVPLLVHHPRLVPASRHDLVSLVDLAPTVLDWVGLPVPAQFEGRSFASALAGGPVLPPRPEFFTCEAEKMHGVVAWPFKYVWYEKERVRYPVRVDFVPKDDWYRVGADPSLLGRLRGEGTVGAPVRVHAELFDLSSDPRELANLVEAQPRRAAELHELATRNVFTGAGGDLDPNRVVLWATSGRPSRIQIAVHSDWPLKLEAPQGNCGTSTVRTPDRRTLELDCQLPAGGLGGLRFFRSRDGALDLTVTRDGKPVSPGELFFGEFGLPASGGTSWHLSPSALPEPTAGNPPLAGGRDEGVLLFRRSPIWADPRRDIGIAKAFAEWGYGRKQ